MMRWDVLNVLAGFHLWSHGAELGVLKGQTLFSLMENNPALKMYGVDIWKQRPEADELRDKGGRSYRKYNMEACYRDVAERSRKFYPRVKLLRMSTAEAAEQVPDYSLDFVFIDADHTEAGVRADIEAWRPKLRMGGYMLGHDIDWPSVRAGVSAAGYSSWITLPCAIWIVGPL